VEGLRPFGLPNNIFITIKSGTFRNHLAVKISRIKYEQAEFVYLDRPSKKTDNLLKRDDKKPKPAVFSWVYYCI